MIGSPPPEQPPVRWFCYVCDEPILNTDDFTYDDTGVRHTRCIPKPVVRPIYDEDPLD